MKDISVILIVEKALRYKINLRNMGYILRRKQMKAVKNEKVKVCIKCVKIY